MLTDEQKHIVIEMIKQLSNPSELEKDILDIIEELSKQSFDMNSAQAKINSIYIKHIDLYSKVNALSSTVQKEACKITEIDLRYILHMQLDFLIQKELETHYNG